MMPDMFIDIFRVSTANVQDNGAAIADRVAATNGKYNNTECSKLPSRYDSQLPLSMITFRT
jgi:hypothetical protein